MRKLAQRSATRDLIDIDATNAAAAIRAGEITSEQLVSACLDRIQARDDAVRAWAYLDPAHALSQARAADRMQAAGRPLGPLHGVPVGVKDNFDTADMPTEYGTPIHAGRRPKVDAAVVSRLRGSGAVIMGKTAIPEFSSSGPVKTVNPLDPGRTPGGSSSGSAAAVADHMVPVAIGTQATGSIIRPASYCGIYGYKASQGAIPRHGKVAGTRHLGQTGVLARSLEDVALVADLLVELGPRDSDTPPDPARSLIASISRRPSQTPLLAFVRTPMWNLADEDARSAYEGFIESMGRNVEEVELPPIFDQARECHTTIYDADVAQRYAKEYQNFPGQISAYFKARIEKGNRTSAIEYIRALRLTDDFSNVLDGIFDRYAAILTPAAAGEAPLGPDATGRAIFSMIWTLCGTPNISVPLLQGRSGMPLGVQLVGRKNADARLLQTARWLVDHIQA
ncbi:MAG: amidase [Betaproteobacteria bacterium]|nr:amidase [Betaproteobacteria bacterium]